MGLALIIYCCTLIQIVFTPSRLCEAQKGFSMLQWGTWSEEGTTEGNFVRKNHGEYGLRNLFKAVPTMRTVVIYAASYLPLVRFSLYEVKLRILSGLNVFDNVRSLSPCSAARLTPA